ncbi:hypothetical protein [Vibrio coralliilyticus]|uniref:hypothetical protein n=1 Tax=Vibrio coralliilyticus TaxID=190893 RepID=UPI00179D3DA4|nr:hypothetical protein [Vibrio coralliilyticus]NUW67113.1 hypothetical protein [Vibrio coralliilyticus]
MLADSDIIQVNTLLLHQCQCEAMSQDEVGYINELLHNQPSEHDIIRIALYVLFDRFDETPILETKVAMLTDYAGLHGLDFRVPENRWL